MYHWKRLHREFSRVFLSFTDTITLPMTSGLITSNAIIMAQYLLAQVGT